MSEKRSWDIQPKKAAPAPVPPPQASRPVPMHAASSRPVPAAKKRGWFGGGKEKRAPRPAMRPMSEPRNRSSATQRTASLPAPAIRVVRSVPTSTQIPKGRDREPLKARRRRAKRRTILRYFILLIILVVAATASLWFSQVRIQHIQTGGPDADGMQTAAMSVLQGTYHYVVPRNSIFFFPEADIRNQILAQYPDISAVSISRVSFNTIAIISIPREAALTWCGPTYVKNQSFSVATTSSSTIQALLPTCYSADAQGIIFAPLSAEAASSSILQIYAPLANNADPSAPLGAKIAEANLIPNALQLIKAIKSLGVPIVTFVMRGDEADLYAQSGTRITYVLGYEEQTAQLAQSAFPSLNLDDGSLEYVDLRFEGKVYFKKVGDTGTTQATSTSSH